MARKGVDTEVRQRIGEWMEWHIERRRKDGVVLTYQQLEERMGLGRGVLTRAVKSGRIGLDVFIKIVREVNVSADTIIHEWPPNARH